MSHEDVQVARQLADINTPGARLLDAVATGDNTVKVAGSTTSVQLPAVLPVASGDRCVVLDQPAAGGRHRIIIGPVDSFDTTSTSWAVTSLNQPGNIGTITTNQGSWRRIGGLVFWRFRVTVESGAAGIAANEIQANVSNLPDPSEIIDRAAGTFDLFDSGSTVYVGSVGWVSTTHIRFQVNASGSRLGVSPSFALAPGDILQAQGWYPG